MNDFDGGWDSRATLKDGWIERTPRRPDVDPRLLAEVRLMPWLAPRLPLAVPVPELVSSDPLVVRHRLVPGIPLTSPTAEHGRALGLFLRALHDTDVHEATAHGLRDIRDEFAEDLALFRGRVLPLLSGPERAAGAALLDALDTGVTDTVVHGDLGPEHVLVEDGRLSGVIDFGDAHAGDPAIDLSWTLYGTPPAFAEALATAYGVTPELRARGLLWHSLGPWYEVTRGQTTDDPAMQATGLEAVRSRLTLLPGEART
ncbi:aminoglycoside phosphotransferase [Actinomadura logoneensis]|uniref:Aminoglycoside phosphotransferase n=1 Tax=Actinomadura logoneensis TaxID=2293572 RepID=A0A372JHL5_9ACTN|nr:phosphotransferase [Actinomadura logoneensis]RFU39497.1 aminoglycoside phosphotransferase [Actinomadura logoneensis]